MTKQTYIKKGGSWKEVKSVWIKKGGVWVKDVMPFVRKGGAWKECMSYGGHLFGWGYNDNYQIGDGTDTRRNSPVVVGSSENWKKVQPGYYHSLGLKDDGTLWSWGRNRYGQLGNGTIGGISGADTETPTQIGTDTNWADIATARNTCLALKTNGTLWAWGRNSSGQLGIGSTTDTGTPTQVGSATDWDKIGRGHHTSHAIKTNGTLWGWGFNDYGTVGDGTTTQRTSPVQIGSDTNWAFVSSSQHTVALKTNNTLYTWGRNTYGQLGQGDSGDGTERDTPTQVGTDTDWDKAQAGGHHSIALKTDGKIYTWGWNQWGQCGNGESGSDADDVLTPTQMGSDDDWEQISSSAQFNHAIKSNDKLYGWGIGICIGDGATSTRNTPVQVGTDDWEVVSSGILHVLGLKKLEP